MLSEIFQFSMLLKNSIMAYQDLYLNNRNLILQALGLQPVLGKLAANVNARQNMDPKIVVFIAALFQDSVSC